jgi:hypothetical protein
VSIGGTALGVPAPAVLAPVGLGWLCVYWIVFVRKYLRLTHAGAVAAAMLTISGLCVAIAVTLMWITRTGGW